MHRATRSILNFASRLRVRRCEVKAVQRAGNGLPIVDIVLPKPPDTPATAPERSGHVPVPVTVGFQLRRPEARILLWKGRMSRT